VCLAEVKRLWEGLWSHQELVSGDSKSCTCVGTSWNKVGWLPSLPSSLIQPPGTTVGSRGIVFYDSVNIRAELLAQSSNSQEKGMMIPAPPLCSPGHRRYL
jgi:vesicle coat complex subunit